MRKLIVFTLLAVLLIPAIALAGVHGIIKGKVVDSDGKGVLGASVLVEGTSRGTYVKDKDGSFVITNVSAGSYKLKVTAVGKSPSFTEIRVSADQTTDVSIKLKEVGVTTGTIEVVGDRNEMIDKNAQGNVKSRSSAELNRVARDGIAGIIATSASVQNSGGGFSINGARSTESQIRVDGLDVGNQFTGGFGIAGSAYYPMVSTLATEEVQVISGNFSAEYGEALGGVVNTVVKTGRNDRYEGFLTWSTDIESLYGSQTSSIAIENQNNKLVPVEKGEGLKYQGPNQNTIEFGFGGPLGFLNRSTFFLSGSYFHEKYRDNSYKVLDPVGNNWGQLPNNGSWKKNITGRFKFQLSDNIQLTTGGQFGLSNFELSSNTWLYSNDYGTPLMTNGEIDVVNGTPTSNGIPERIAKQNAINQLVYNGLVRINHTLTDRSYYELTVSFNANNDENARRVGNESPGYFSGFELYEPSDKYEVVNQQLVKSQPDATGRIGDHIVDIYQSLAVSGMSKDGYLRKEWLAKNPLTGYYEGRDNSSGSSNPYGLAKYFQTSGADGGFEFRGGSYWQVDGNYTNVFEMSDFKHEFRGGFELRLFELNRHYNGSPWDGNPWYDIYTDQWGGNIYGNDPAVYEKTSKPYKPMKVSAFVQDKIIYKGITIAPGLRFDMLDPNANYRTPAPLFTSIKSDSGFASTTMKAQISPRINIIYPITEKSQFSIAYGLFYKSPEFQRMYDKFATELLRSGDILGNPNMEAQKTNQYSIKYDNEIADNFAVSVTTYFRDIYNQLGVVKYTVVPIPYYQYAVSEYGNAKGISFELRKAPTMEDHFGFDANYTLAYVEGTSSSPASNSNVAIDPYTDKPAFPLATYPQGNDTRHTINAGLYFIFGNDDGPAIGSIQPLENVTFSFQATYASGSPYTKVDKNGKTLSEINAERQPDYFNVDLRVTKQFYLRDWFGESANNSVFEVYADIKNILNRRVPVGVFAVTGDADDNGTWLERKIGDFISTPLYKDANFANAASFRAEQYDDYGNRLYSENADLDKNGVVTQAEKYQGYLNLVEKYLSFRSNYQLPIRISAGIRFKF